VRGELLNSREMRAFRRTLASRLRSVGDWARTPIWSPISWRTC